MRKAKALISFLLVLVFAVGFAAIPASAAEQLPNTYVNTGDQLQDTLGVARSQVGYKERGNNSTKYGTWYHLPNKPWCAMFISWCARKAEVPKSILKNSAVASAAKFGLKYHDATTKPPEAGDLFYTKKFSHVGLVYFVDGDYFYTIEANSNNDGSDDGNRVLCNKRPISDFYFSTPEYENKGAAPAAPKIKTSQKTPFQYEKVTFSWDPVKDAKSYTLILYFNGDISQTVELGTKTQYSFTPQKVGDYLVSVSANYADGKIGFSQNAVTVKPVAKLTAYYHPGTGELPKEAFYVVAEEGGINMRKSSSTSSEKLTKVPTGTKLAVTQTKSSGGYLWGKTTYGEYSGWCALDKGLCQQVGFGLNDKGLIVSAADQTAVTTVWEATQNQERVLESDSTLDLTKAYHTFVGWSDTPDGSGVLFKNTGVPLSAEELAPDFSRSDKNVTLYAQWKKTVKSIAVQEAPQKTAYYTDEALNTSGLKLQVSYADGTSAAVTSGFTTSGYSAQKAGKQTVTVTYEGQKATFEVTVKNRLEYELQDGKAIVTGYESDGNGGIVIVPEKLEGCPVTQIGPGAFSGSDLTGIILPDGLKQIGEGAFAGCDDLETVNFTGSQEAWDQIQIGDNNQSLLDAALHTDYKVVGDFDGNMKVDYDDVLYLLWHTLFEEDFPIKGRADFDDSGAVTYDDVLYLLWHTLYPEDFPLITETT